MNFKMVHNNLNVFDLQKSLAFYKEALGLTEVRRYEQPDGYFILVFLGDGIGEHRLELTWLRDRDKPYDLGDNEIHIAFVTDDYEVAYQKHKDLGCVCQESNGNFYFIEDPDGYWLEIIKKR